MTLENALQPVSGTSGNLAALPAQRSALSAEALGGMRQVAGYPAGSDSAIAEMSLPPYYTACPNPFIKEIVAGWISVAIGNARQQAYHREPFAADVAEGKHDPIYKIHSYHTKVPPRAILRYILHYTSPGDIVLDAFCGSGMTGVAAQLCGSSDIELRAAVEAEWRARGKRLPEWGARRAILSDLSPAASTIAANYNIPIDAAAFQQAASQLIAESRAVTDHLYNYEGAHGPFGFAVWSQIFLCPHCSSRLNFMEQAFDAKTKEIRDEFECPNCSSVISKDALEKSFVSEFDPLRGGIHRQVEYELFLVARGARHRRRLSPATDSDQELVERATALALPSSVPVVRMPLEHMYHGSRLLPKGVEYVHDLFFRRQAFVLADLWQRTAAVDDRRLRSALRFLGDQVILPSTKLARYPQLSPLGGVYYLPSMVAENEPLSLMESKVEALARYFSADIARAGQVVISTNSASQIPGLEDSTIDYIFTDPPFGENIFYADLNFVVESWYGVFTSSASEAIIDKPKNKDLDAYEALMLGAFQEYYRVLKSGHWITVVFHNSNNSVWNAIQQAMGQAGFVVADVRILDKQQKSYRQVTSSAVKQDLVISAYKPTEFLQRSFEKADEATAWEFVREHLKQLPVFLAHEGELEIIKERDASVLFDKMVAAHVQRGITIPMDLSEFRRGLFARFPERDGMFFLPDQAASFDVSRSRVHKIEQLAFYIVDERSALQWIRNELNPDTGSGPQSYSDLQPKFLRELHQVEFEDLPELRELLGDNFLQDSNGRWYVPNPEDQADLDALRERALLREFGHYLQGKGKLKVFRTEAIRAGFSDAWRKRNYGIIVKMTERLPESVIQADPQLLMYYHNASLRQSAEPKQDSLL